MGGFCGNVNIILSPTAKLGRLPVESIVTVNPSRLQPPGRAGDKLQCLIFKKTFAENVSVVHVLNLCRSKLISSHFHGLTIQACLLSCFTFCIVAAFDVERRTLLSRRGLNGPAASSPRHYSQQSPGSDGTCPCSYHYGGMLLLRNTSCSFCLGLFSTFPE